MKALVLSGGSIKGSFQAGAIVELLNAGYAPDSIYGVSVGSLNGAFITDRASRYQQNGKIDWTRIAIELESLWKNNINSFDKIGEKNSDIGVLWQMIWSNFNGLIDTSRLHNLIRSLIKENNLRASPVKFTVGSVNLANGEFVQADSGYPNILDYTIASTAIPIMMPISKINNQPLVDGGVRNVAPLKYAIDDGADSIICIACQPKQLQSITFEGGNLLQYSDRLMDIVINGIVTNDLEWADYINTYCPKDGTKVQEGPLKGCRYIPIGIIRPKTEPQINIENFTAADIAQMIDLGHYAAKEALKTDTLRKILAG
ncbi:MAG: patatin-like phospholipase family protein [Bacteroidota bacterium]